MILEILTLGFLALLAYAWGIYPALLAFLAKRVPARPTEASGTIPPADWTVAVLLSAHNEETHIHGRLQNLLAARAELPPDSRYTIWVGIDGSRDRTAEIAEAFAREHPEVHVVRFEPRRGKTAVLKDLVRLSAEHTPTDRTRFEGHAFRISSAGQSSATLGCSKSLSEAPEDTDILVFTDANTMFRPGALTRLLAPLRDPTVGGVCGRLILKPDIVTPGASPKKESQQVHARMEHAGPPPSKPFGAAPSSEDHPEKAYWDWESRLKAWESRLDSCLGANGAIYAIRRALFWGELPDNTMVDDFVIGMKVREQGRRILFEPEAVAEEELPPLRHEWRRRVRIGAGDYQALVLCRRCLGPSYGKFAWMFWSHKVLRWFTPHLLLGGTLLGLGSFLGVWRPGRAGPVRGMAEGALLLVLGAAALCVPASRVLGRTRAAGGRWHRVVSAGAHFVCMQAALFVGFLRFCRGDLSGQWARTPRQR